MKRNKRLRHWGVRVHRPCPDRLVGWTGKDEEGQASALREAEEFMERYCAAFGTRSLPMVDARRYSGFRGADENSVQPQTYKHLHK